MGRDEEGMGEYRGEKESDGESMGEGEREMGRALEKGRRRKEE